MERRASYLWLACVMAAAATTPVRAQQLGESVLHAFAAPPNGANPWAGVIRDAAGNLYGTAYLGGPANAGVVYKVDPMGHQTVLYSFTGGEDGKSPQGGVILDAAGNLYGATVLGGEAGQGVVFKLDPSGHETVLHSFRGDPDGANPCSGVIRDSTGSLYGTTAVGGLGNGVVYKLDVRGHETVLYRFTNGADGGRPCSGVIRDPEGNLYGTTPYGGAGAGVVYRVDPTRQETVLYTFNGTSPVAGVIRDPEGNLYGTTYGYYPGGYGTVYKLDASGQETVLYTFYQFSGGQGPNAGVIRDSAGNLYGTTSYGGTGYGVVYKVDPTGMETVLYRFTGGLDGYFPYAGVVADSEGNLYGTTLYGGPANLGVVYELGAQGALGREKVLYGFSGVVAGGRQPDAGVVRDAAGNLYGTTYYGGTANAGVVYKIDIQERETVLYNFSGGADGANPEAGVILDAVGNLYGTTYNGGMANGGVVFKLDPAGHETVLHSFTGGDDGSHPRAGVTSDAVGNLYGTVVYGGAGGQGVVYKLDPAGHLKVVYSFPGGANGGGPFAGVTLDSAGNLYGTTLDGGGIGFGTSGVVYKVTPSGEEIVLSTFAAGGAYPYSGVVLDAAGNLYGTTWEGGTANAGVVYKVNPAGQETILYNFSGGTDGGYPQSGVTLDSAGNLYGTTAAGASGGVVYKLDPAGQETVLYTFTGGTDGCCPYAGVILDPAGNLYGTTPYDGKTGSGVVFKINRNVGN